MSIMHKNMPMKYTVSMAFLITVMFVLAKKRHYCFVFNIKLQAWITYFSCWQQNPK